MCVRICLGASGRDIETGRVVSGWVVEADGPVAWCLLQQTCRSLFAMAGKTDMWGRAVGVAKGPPVDVNVRVPLEDMYSGTAMVRVGVRNPSLGGTVSGWR